MELRRGKTDDDDRDDDADDDADCDDDDDDDDDDNNDEYNDDNNYDNWAIRKSPNPHVPAKPKLVFSSAKFVIMVSWTVQWTRAQAFHWQC